VKPLRRVGELIARGLEAASHKGSTLDYSSMTSQQLWALAGIDDSVLTESDHAAIAYEREQIIADPKGWARDYLAETDPLNREIMAGIFRYLDRVSFPTGDHLAGYAVWLVARVLEDLGHPLRPWYEAAGKPM
jgi:hypothetical protein